MKLMFDLPPRDEAAYLAAADAAEKRMYCVPYDFEDDRRVTGYMMVTDRRIYRILEGQVLDSWALREMSDFNVETFYGACGFYAKVRGNTTLLCRFISGRNLPRYSVLVTACEQLCSGNAKLLTSNEPERFCPKCGRPFVVHTKICPFCQSKKEIYQKLWGMTRGLRLMMLFPLLAAIFSVIFRFVVPAAQKLAINYYIYPSSGVSPSPLINALRSWLGDDKMEFVVIVIAIVTLDLVYRLISVIQSRLATISGNQFTRMMRALLFEKIQTLSMSSIQTKSTGDLMGRINNDVAVVQNFITNLLPTYFAQAFSFIMAILLLIWLSPTMCLFIFVPLPFAIFFIVKFWSYMQKRNVRAWILDQRTNRGLQDVLNGVRVVKAYGNEERAIADFERNTANQARQDESNAKLFDTLFPILGFVVHFGSYLILMFGNLWLYQGRLDLGTLNQFNSYAGIVYEPLMQITAIPRNISSFITSLSKVLEILEEEPEVSDIALPLDIRIEGDVDINHVTFGYDSYNPVLKDVDVHIRQGEMIGIVGHSGCGKTTLINLIMRLYDVTEGSITIDDVNIRDISQNALRSQIGVVLQETHLFSGSVRDNIRYAKPMASNEEIMAAARLANAHDFIMNLPEGYNTMVGEKGYSLSGGERQRIAIARALIHDPRILILDEATAALDTETEKLIQDAIAKVTVGRTTFAIAHRLSTLRNANKLLVLDHGRLAEFGTHAELLAKKGIYYKLVMAQHRATLAKQAGVDIG